MASARLPCRATEVMCQQNSVWSTRIPCPCGPGACLLPALLSVGRRADLAVAHATHPASSPPLSGRDPAPMLTRHDITRRGKLHVVTAGAGTAERNRLRAPDLIVPGFLPHQCVGNRMQSSRTYGACVASVSSTYRDTWASCSSCGTFGICMRASRPN